MDRLSISRLSKSDSAAERKRRSEVKAQLFARAELETFARKREAYCLPPQRGKCKCQPLAKAEVRRFVHDLATNLAHGPAMSDFAPRERARTAYHQGNGWVFV